MEQIAARGVIVEFTDQQPIPPSKAELEYLVTVATFRNHVQAHFAQTRLLSAGIQTFLFDDNTIRMDWFWSTALGGVKLRVSDGDVGEALEVLRAGMPDQADAP